MATPRVEAPTPRLRSTNCNQEELDDRSSASAAVHTRDRRAGSPGRRGMPGTRVTRSAWRSPVATTPSGAIETRSSAAAPSHDRDGQWWRSYGNELWEFNQDGLMVRREASINDVRKATGGSTARAGQTRIARCCLCAKRRSCSTRHPQASLAGRKEVDAEYPPVSGGNFAVKWQPPALSGRWRRIGPAAPFG
jgi:hypothetical protein